MPPPTSVALIGAPFCEGQNLEGADLAPMAMREAGLEDAVRQLGLSWHDVGDIDFSSVTPGKKQSRYAVSLYREWLASSSKLSFSIWMQQRAPVQPASPEIGPVDGKEAAGRKRSHDKIGA